MKVYVVLCKNGYESWEYNIEVFEAKEDAEKYASDQRKVSVYNFVEIIERNPVQGV